MAPNVGFRANRNPQAVIIVGDETTEGVSTSSYTLLSDASATGDYVEVAGGYYIWSAAGTFNGATLTLQALGPDGATAMDIDTLSSAGSAGVDIGNGSSIRVAVSVAVPSGIYSDLTRVS